MCTGARQRGRNGLRYYSPTGIPSHTAHRIKSRGKKGEQEGQCKLAHSPASDVEKGRTSKRALTGDVQEGVFEDWHLRSGSIGARALNPITAGPLPATLLGPLASHPTINKHTVLVHVNRLHSGGELSLRGALLHLGIDSVPSTYISGLTLLACPEQIPPESTERSTILKTRSISCVDVWSFPL